MPDLTNLLESARQNWVVVAVAIAALAWTNKDVLLAWGKKLLPSSATPAPTKTAIDPIATVAQVREFLEGHGETEALAAIDTKVLPAIIRHAYDK